MPPYRMYYIRSKKCYTVKKTKTKKNALTKKKKVFSKCTTKANATKQIRLLRAILYNPNFRRKVIKKEKTSLPSLEN